MPFYAIDNHTAERVHIEYWLEPRYQRGDPICTICHSIFTIIGEHSPNRSTHFRHPENTNCPSIPKNAVPYQQLQNIPIDITQIDFIKDSFLTNIHKIFNKCKELIPNPSFKELDELIQKANSLNIWGYVDINIEYF